MRYFFNTIYTYLLLSIYLTIILLLATILTPGCILQVSPFPRPLIIGDVKVSRQDMDCVLYRRETKQTWCLSGISPRSEKKKPPGETRLWLVSNFLDMRQAVSYLVLLSKPLHHFLWGQLKILSVLVCVVWQEIKI